MKEMTPNKKRRLAILERASHEICACNIEYCFALTDEPQMKWLIKKDYIRLERRIAVRRGGKGVTMAEITEEGRKYLAENKPV